MNDGFDRQFLHCFAGLLSSVTTIDAIVVIIALARWGYL